MRIQFNEKAIQKLWPVLEIAGILKTTPDELESGNTLEEDSTINYTNTEESQLIIQLREDIAFLKETIQHQWQLLKELSKS